jgi:hypothetical protein
VSSQLAKVLDTPADAEMVIKYNQSGRVASVKITKTKPALPPNIVARAENAIKSRLSEEKLQETWLSDKWWNVQIPNFMTARCQVISTHMFEMAPVPQQPSPQPGLRRKN